MSPRDAAGASRFFVWFLFVCGLLVFLLGFLVGGWESLLWVGGILATVFGAQLLMTPLVWLLARISSRKSIDTDKK
jgi:hypothetical protein